MTTTIIGAKIPSLLSTMEIPCEDMSTMKMHGDAFSTNKALPFGGQKSTACCSQV